jgi:hypothetical protein
MPFGLFPFSSIAEKNLHPVYKSYSLLLHDDVTRILRLCSRSVRFRWPGLQ